MASSIGGDEERKDCFYLETLALPSEIQSMVVGRFFDKNVESLILAKSTFLSVFHNNEEEDNFDFVDHICVYKEIYCLCTSVQPNSLDCLFILSINGEWMLMQWTKTKFFPLASGSILKAIQPLMKNPEQRRFRLDPTFQWAVSVVPITDNSPRFFTRPSPKHGLKRVSGSNKPIVRISFRAVIVVDETVFVGVKYDGPDANFLSVIKNNWSVALKQFPGKFGFFNPDNRHGYKEENVNIMIRNGLENEWKVLQSVEQNKKNLCIANADTFIFFEDDEDQPLIIQQQENKLKQQLLQQQQQQLNTSLNQQKQYLQPLHHKKNTIHLFQLINRVRHLTFTTSMKLNPFPVKKKPYIMPSFPFASPLGRENDGEICSVGLSEIERRGRLQLPEFSNNNNNASVKQISSSYINLNRKQQQQLQLEQQLNQFDIQQQLENGDEQNNNSDNFTNNLKFQQVQSQTNQQKQQNDDNKKISTTINQKSQSDISNHCCTTAIALVDTPIGLNLLSLLFDFDNCRIQIHSFVMTAIPPSASRLMPIIDETRVMKTLKGEDIKLLNRVHAGDANLVKGALAQSNEQLNQYYSSDNSIYYQGEKQIEKLNDECKDNNTPLKHNSTSPYSNAQSASKIQMKSNSQSEAINQLHKHIIKQQFKQNIFIITFPNKIIHKSRFKVQMNNGDSSNDDDQSQISSTTTGTDDNTDNYRIIVEQTNEEQAIIHQQIENENIQKDSLIFTKSASNLRNSLSTNEHISNFHPFLIITSVGVILFTSHLTLLKFQFPIPFTEPPMCCLYAGGQEKDLNNLNSLYLYGNNKQSLYQMQSEKNMKKTQRHRPQRDVHNLDKLFIASGRGLIVIANGQIQKHHYPFKWFNQLAMTNGANWYLSLPSETIKSPPPSEQIKEQQQQKDLQMQSSIISIINQINQADQTDQQQQQNVLDLLTLSPTSPNASDESSSSKSDIDRIQLKIGTSMLFIISASNSSMIVDMSTGAFYDFPGSESEFKELNEGGPEDFQYNSICVSSVVPIPNQFYSPFHQIEDRIVLGVGNGRTGALHTLGLGNKLQTIMHGKWYDELPTLFTTRAYSGAQLHALLLVEEENIIDINKDEQQQQQQQQQQSDKQQTKIQRDFKRQQQYSYPYASPPYSQDNLRQTYTSSVYSLHEEVVEPIDSAFIGIDNQKKTLAFSGAQGAFVQITTSDVRIIPTLKFSAHFVSKTTKKEIQEFSDETSESQQEQQQDTQQEQKDEIEKIQEIRSEFVGFDAQHGIIWPAPVILTEEQCQLRIETLQHSGSNTSPYKSMINQSSINQQPQKIVFECACVSDNLIAISYKCIVFVLVWNPSKPKIIQTSPVQDQQQQQQQHQPDIQQTISQIPAILRPVATLCFPSKVISLNASTICTRSFLIVGCDSPAAVFLFRLDNIQISQLTEQARKKLWDDGERLLNTMKYQIAYPTVQRPDLRYIIQNGIKNNTNSDQDLNEYNNRHSVRFGESNECSVITGNYGGGSLTRGSRNQQQSQKQIRFIEVMSGSRQYVEVQYSSNAIMTALLDLYTFDRPQQILLTTFNRHVRIFTQEEVADSDLNPLFNITPRTEGALAYQSSESDDYFNQRNYLRNDGSVLLIAGANGQLSSVIIPLTSLLDFEPSQPKKGKKLSSAQFFFPSIITTMRLFPMKAKIVEDESTVYLYGDRAFALTWNDRVCKIVWTDLENSGIIHSLQPMHVVDQNQQLQLNNENSGNKQTHNHIRERQHTIKEDDNIKTQLPHPTLAWIDYVEKKLTFGTVDKRSILTRQIKDLPSLPLAVAYIPTLHAVACLCREQIQHKYYDPVVEDNEIYDPLRFIDNRNKNDCKQQQNKTNQTSDVYEIDQNMLTGLGLDVSGISSVDQQLYMPFHEIFVNYLQEREKINENKQYQIDCTKSPQSTSSNSEQLNNLSIKKRNQFSRNYKQSQFFHDSISDVDGKGDLFIDIAADWYIESHSKHYKDYRPKRLPPYKSNAPKVNLCYSSKTNFSIAYPQYLSPMTVAKALENQNLRMNFMKINQLFKSNDEFIIHKDQQITPKNEDQAIEINSYLPLPSNNQQSQIISQSIVNTSSMTPLPSDIQNQIKYQHKNQKIELTTQSYEQFVKTITNSYVIILYDETEMDLRIGYLNLSRQILDFGKNLHDLQNIQTNSINQNKMIKAQSYQNIDNVFQTTELYNFFNMACVPIPTQQGFNETMKIQRGTYNELTEASKEFGYDQKNVDQSSKLLNDIDFKENLNGSNMIKQMIKLQNQLDRNQSKIGTQSSNQYQQKEQIDEMIQNNEKFDQNEYLTRKQTELEEYRKRNNFTFKNDFEMLKPMRQDEFNDRYARSLLCIAGRESTFGSQNFDFSQSSKDPNSNIHQNDDMKSEPLYESAITDIFIYEVDRHHILANGRIQALNLLEKQLINKSKNQNNENCSTHENQIHFTDEQIQSSIDESEKLEHSYGDFSTSAMSQSTDKMYILNVSIILQKRIRFLGGVQGLYTQPSTLVVLNGRGAHVFLLGPRLDDANISIQNNIYKITAKNKMLQQSLQKKKSQEKDQYDKINDELDKIGYIFKSVDDENDQFYHSEYCSCTCPLFSESGDHFQTIPYHTSITNVRNIVDSKGKPKIWSVLQLPKIRQLFAYSNDNSAFPTKPIENYSIYSPFAFNILQAALIIAPSPITSFSMQWSQIRPSVQPLPTSVLSSTAHNQKSTFRTLTAHHKQTNLIPEYLIAPPFIRAALVFAPCGFAFIDLVRGYSAQLNNIMEANKHQQRFCTWNQKDIEIIENLIQNSKESIQCKKQIKKKKKKKAQIQKQINKLPQINFSKILNIEPENQSHSIKNSQKNEVQEKISLIEPSIMSLCFAQRRCFHCNRVYKIPKFYPSEYLLKSPSEYSIRSSSEQSIKSPSESSLHNYSSYEKQFIQKDALFSIQILQSDNSSELNNSQISSINQLQSMKLPSMSGSDLASVSGIYLKHRPRDLVQTGSVFCHKARLICQAYSPTLIVDAEQLGMDQIGVLGDREILIYQLVPNPLYKKMIHKRFMNNQNIDQQTKDFEYLPICCVLSVRVPASRHYSFLIKFNAGVNSIYESYQSEKIRKTFRDLEQLKNSILNQAAIDNDNNTLKKKSKMIQINNFEESEDEVLHADDLNDEYYMHKAKPNQSFFDLLNISPKGSLQNLPAIPSFLVISNTGAIIRSVPASYDFLPVKDVFLSLHVFSIYDMKFGDLWRHQQTKMLRDYWNVEEQTFRLTCIEETLREYVATGKIARRPPIAQSDYLPPIFGLRDGRFFESQTFFGISQLPITTSATNWRVLNLQNILTSLEIMKAYQTYSVQSRLICRESIRRFINNYKTLGLPEGRKDDIEEKDHYIILMKLIYSFLRSIGRPAQMLHSDIPKDLIQGVQYLFNQSRAGMHQLMLALKFPDEKFINKIKKQFYNAPDQERILDHQLWIKYRDFILLDDIGIKNGFNPIFKENQLVSGPFPATLASTPIKISKKSKLKPSECALDLYHISEKLLFNKNTIHNIGLNQKLNTLFQSLVTINKTVQMISKSNQMYEKIHNEPTDEKHSSDEDNAFLNKFTQQQIPMFIQQSSEVQQVNQIQKAKEKQSKNDPVIKQIQKRVPREFDKAIQKQNVTPQFDSKQLNSQSSHTHKHDHHSRKNNQFERNYHEKDKQNKQLKEKELFRKTEKEKKIRNENDHKYKKLKEKDIIQDKTNNKDKNSIIVPEQENKLFTFNPQFEMNYQLELQNQNTTHPLRKFELPPIDENDQDWQQTQFIDPEMSLSEDALKDFSDTTTETDKDQTNKSSLFFGKKYESVLQRVQLTQHFTHYTKNLKDKDWAENIGIMQQQPQQTQIEEQEEENLTSDKQQIQIQSPVIIEPQLSIPINLEDMQNFTQIQQNQIIPIDQESPLLLSPKINNITKMEIEQEFELPGSPTFYASSHQPISNFPTVKLSLCENILPYRSLDDRLIKNKPGAIPLIASNDDEEAEIDDTFEIVDIQEEKDLN